VPNQLSFQQEILLIQLKRIGDLVLTAPVIQALKERYPNARVTIALDAAFASIAEILPADDFLFFKKKTANLDFWRRLAGCRWDACYEFTGTDRGLLMALVSRAGTRVAYERHRGFLSVLAVNRFVQADVKSLHAADYHLALAGVTQQSLGYPLRISGDLRKSVMRMVHELGINGPFAVVHPGTARPEKMWSPDNWARAVQLLQDEAGLQVLFTGGNDPAELEQIGSISAMAGRDGIFSLAGKTTLAELAALIALARVFAGVDTGASHMADLLGIPSAVLYGGTNPRNWGPRGSKGRAVGVTGVSVYPHDFPKSEMRDIPFENLAAALRGILAE